MIIGLWHPGSGLGDQLFCYLAARITAQRLGVTFTMYGDFKGKDFIKLFGGTAVKPFDHHVEVPAGKIIIEASLPVYEGKTYYDPEFNFITDNTIVDGCRLQDERYWEGYPIGEWLKTAPLIVPNDVCVIGFRGGEYATVPELFLTRDYWEEAIFRMRKKGVDKFEVHTDDPVTAGKMLSGLIPAGTQIIHDIGINWRSVRHARNLIIANSAFYILPALLNENVETVIAPRYWARRNIKQWSTPQSYYPKFTYL